MPNQALWFFDARVIDQVHSKGGYKDTMILNESTQHSSVGDHILSGIITTGGF